MRRVTVPWLVVLVMALAALASACAAGPSTRPAIVAAGGAESTPPHVSHPHSGVPPLVKPEGSRVTWHDCDAETRARLGAPAPPAGLRFQCGQIFMVLNSSDQQRPIPTRLSVLRAGNGEIPLVVLNDIGGQPGTLYAARLAGDLPPKLRHRFFLVGIDRRGTGSSDGLNCIPTEVRAKIVGHDPVAGDLSELLHAARTATQRCVVGLNNTLHSFNTWQTAAQLNHVRATLGAARLNAIGHGEASRVLTTFAGRFPDKTGRLVLDGAPDPAVDVQQRAESQARAAEQTFDVFAARCTAGDCPLGAKPRQAVRGLLDTLRRSPLHVADGTLITAGTAISAMLRALPHPRLWEQLQSALAAARSGDGSGLARLVKPLLTGSSERGSRLDARIVVGCNNEPTRLPPEKIRAALNAWQQRIPLFGGAFADTLALCSPWPVPNRTLPGPDDTHAPPALVLATEHDLLTPARGTKRMAHQLANARLVSWPGTGHGALAASPCAARITTRFLTAGILPADGTVCPP